jgi:hypothetical protein
MHDFDQLFDFTASGPKGNRRPWASQRYGVIMHSFDLLFDFAVDRASGKCRPHARPLQVCKPTPADDVTSGTFRR